ncbi:DUF3883 domain-containing protein [Lewinella sp. IMCC34183]|uniref:DUF3883 domain-containing protein n=1 Tax=Lewinella sp. IMCC34183 TaxID=2248762 RepID=UPI000E283769|nr:DUF3883 domain-containing protein [Lewinella sp. IMCC34183]
MIYLDENGQRLRRLLIENAFNNGKPVYYSTAAEWIKDELGYAHSQEFANLLGDVSEYEYESSPQRPFLSATVIYKNPSRSVKYDARYGDGLINRALAMGLDKKSNFDPLSFGRDEESAAFKFWSHLSRYKQFKDYVPPIAQEPAEPIAYSAPTVPFFTVEEMGLFHELAGRQYLEQSIGEAIKETINKKVRFWQEQLLSRFNMTDTNVSENWQQSGNIKKYIWGRLNRPEDEEADVFFTIDAMGTENRLKARLGYNFGRTNHFSSYQINRLEEITASNTDFFSVPAQELQGWDWERLVVATNRFIDRKWEAYQSAIEYVRGITTASQESRLRTGNFPVAPAAASAEDNTDAPIDPTGSGQDFAALAQRRHVIGEEGEDYVRDILEVEYPDWSFEKMPAGSRYDIRGKTEGQPDIEVEVKTTTSTDESAPFYVSVSELEYAKRTTNCYYLYRVTGLGGDQQKVAYRLTRDELMKRTRTAITFQIEGK